MRDGRNISRRGFIGHAAGLYTLVAAGSVGAVVTYDPMGQLIGAIKSNWQHAEALSLLEDDASLEVYNRDVMSPLWSNLYRQTPETTTISGAAAALRYLLDLGGMPSEDASVVRSVAEFLETQVN